MKKTKYPSFSTIEYNITNFADGIDATTDENVTDFDRAVNSYNFEYKNGALTESLGFEDLSTPSTHDEGCSEVTARFQLDEEKSHEFVKIAHFKDYDINLQEREDRIFLIAKDNIPCYVRLITGTPIFAHLRQISPTECPKMANYHNGIKDVMLFYSDADGVYSWDAQYYPTHYENLPKIYDFCEYNGKIYAILSGERLTIRIENSNLFTWPSEPTKLITFESERGYLNKLLSFNGYLFVIRDFGISRLDANSNISHLLCSGSRMYANTACVCGNRGIILGKDGLYEFNGISAQKLNLKINRLLKGVSNQHAVGAFKNGVYYLACKLNFGDNKQIGCETGEYINNALIAFDTQTNKYSITRGVDICHLCAIQYDSADKLLAVFNGQFSTRVGQLTTDGKFFGNSETRFWSSPLSDMGYSDKVKYIKEISLLSLYDITVKVFSECESREFSIKGSNIISRLPVRIKGKQIGVSITSNVEKAYISNLKLTANLISVEYV